MDTDLLIAASHASATTSSLCVFILGGLLPGILLTIALTLSLWHKQRALAAKDSVKSGGRLLRGPVVLAGKVNVLDGAPCAVRIRIRQKGFQWKTKNGWGHAWREQDRTVQTWPFYLVMRDAERVRVEPGRKVFLVDAIDRADPDPLSEDQRVLTAELSDGESVVADGVLTRAVDPNAAPASYRTAAGMGWVLRAPPNDKMLLSSEPLQDRYVKRAALHRRWAWVLGAALLALNLSFGRFHLLSIFGDVVQARVEQTTTWKTHTKNGTVTHYGVKASYLDPVGQRHELSDETNSAAWEWLRQRKDEGVSVPFRVVPFRPTMHQMGRRASLHGAHIVIAVLALAVLGMLYVFRARKTLPWYDQRRVVHNGSGMLQPAVLDP